MNIVNLQTKFNVSSIVLFMELISVVLFFLALSMFYLEITRPTQEYFAVDADNKLIKMTALNEPNISTSTLMRWASIAVTSAYTIDFVDYQKELDNLQQYFTKDGYKNYIAITESKVQDIVKQKLVVTAVVSGTPVLLSEGTTDGFYSWKIQIPILLSYQGASEKSTKQNLAVNILVMRVPTKDAYTGIGIAQIQDVFMYDYD